MTEGSTSQAEDRKLADAQEQISDLTDEIDQWKSKHNWIVLGQTKYAAADFMMNPNDFDRDKLDAMKTPFDEL